MEIDQLPRKARGAVTYVYILDPSDGCYGCGVCITCYPYIAHSIAVGDYPEQNSDG